MDKRLLNILVCPICKGPLKISRPTAQAGDADADAPTRELICRPDRLAFPIRDDIPVMLIDEARQLGDDE